MLVNAIFRKWCMYISRKYKGWVERPEMFGHAMKPITLYENNCERCLFLCWWCVTSPNKWHLFCYYITSIGLSSVLVDTMRDRIRYQFYSIIFASSWASSSWSKGLWLGAYTASTYHYRSGRCSGGVIMWRVHFRHNNTTPYRYNPRPHSPRLCSRYGGRREVSATVRPRRWRARQRERRGVSRSGTLRCAQQTTKWVSIGRSSRRHPSLSSSTDLAS